MAERLSLPHRFWRLLPAAARRAALRRAAVALAPVKDAAPPARSDGVVVGGEFAETTGLGEAARVYQAACVSLGAARGRLALRVGGRAATPPAGGALLLTVNAPSLPLMLALAPRDLLRGRFVIGAWAWELPVVPEEWRIGARYVHEVWACSAFTAAALEPILPGRVRIVPYPLAAVWRPGPERALRADYGLPEHAVVTTVIFGLGSSFARKNPLAAIAAFRAAFGGRPDRILVVKVSGQAAFPAEAAAITAAADAPNIRLFAESWPAARLDGLLAVSDIVLSLHRAEGLGLVPAQAMLRGIPVVATGWSGNLQFMDADSAALVGYSLVPVRDPSGVYGKIPGAMWAEPDVEQAAAALRRLGDDPAARAALGARGQAKARAALAGDELRTALREAGITA